MAGACGSRFCRFGSKAILGFFQAAVALPICLGQVTQAEINNNYLILKKADGSIIKQEDVGRLTGSVRYEIIGSQKVPKKAIQLHQLGRKTAERGGYEEALDYFREANSIAAEWPYPLYDIAFTYLLLGDGRSALEYYEKVDRLAPEGYFEVKTAVFSLRKEEGGELPRGTYLTYLSMEWASGENEKREIAERLIETAPDYAPAWKELALRRLDDPKAKEEALDRGLALEADNETKGVLLINKALLAANSGNKQRAIQILGDLAISSESTLGTRQGALFCLKTLVQRK